MARPPLESAAQSIPPLSRLGSSLMCWGTADAEPAPCFPMQLAVAWSSQGCCLPSCGLSLLGSGVLLLWSHFSLHTQKPSCTLPTTVLVIASPEANPIISYPIHCLLSYFSVAFTLLLPRARLPLSTQVMSPNMPGWPQPPSRLYNLNLLFSAFINFFIWEHISFIIKFHLHRKKKKTIGCVKIWVWCQWAFEQMDLSLQWRNNQRPTDRGHLWLIYITECQDDHFLAVSLWKISFMSLRHGFFIHEWVATTSNIYWKLKSRIQAQEFKATSQLVIFVCLFVCLGPFSFHLSKWMSGLLF